MDRVNRVGRVDRVGRLSRQVGWLISLIRQGEAKKVEWLSNRGKEEKSQKESNCIE